MKCTVLCLFWIPKITFSPRLLCCSFCAICGGHEDDDRQQQQRRRRRRRWSDMIKEPSPPLQDEEKEGEGGRQERTSHLPSKDFLPRWKLDIQGTEDIGYDTVMSQMRPYGLNFDSNCPLSLSLFFWRLQSTGYNTIFTSDQPQQCSYIQYTRYKIHDPLMKYDRLIFMLEERNVNLAGTEKDKFSKHSHNYGE